MLYIRIFITLHLFSYTRRTFESISTDTFNEEKLMTLTRKIFQAES